MKLDQNKFNRQKGIVDKWDRLGRRGTAEAVTR